MREWIRALLRCPRCGALLAGDPPTRCSDPSCALSTHGAFPTVGDQAALIDFVDSIIDRDALVESSGASPVRRARGGLRTQVGRVVHGGNAQAARHASRLLAWLRERGESARLLVVGSGSIGNGADSLYEAGDVHMCGFDIYASTHTDFVADAHRIPLADESFDAVWIQAVLEHVIEPQRVVAEIARVLRADGVVYAETPFMQQVHEGAYDFTRFTESGHRWLFRDFECLDSGVVLGPGTAFWWSLRYTLRALFRSHALAEMLSLPFFWLRFLDGLTSGVYASDAASGVYFFGRKGGGGIGSKDLVRFYHRQRGDEGQCAG